MVYGICICYSVDYGNLQSSQENRRVMSDFEGYEIKDGIIVNPGKFEGCPEYAPYYWNLYLNGEAIETSGGGILKVEPEDLFVYPELKAGNEIHLTENDNGFVTCDYVEVM